MHTHFLPKQSWLTPKAFFVMICVAGFCRFLLVPIQGQDITDADKNLETQLGEMNEKAEAEYRSWDIAGDQALPQDDAGLENQINRMMNDAIAARTAYDLEELENIRFQRIYLIERYFNANPESQSPWVNGVKAHPQAEGL